MSIVTVINASHGYYNVGAMKLKDWLTEQGDEVHYFDGDPGFLIPQSDAVYLSVIFSWNAMVARDIAIRLKDNCQVECGGPGMFALGKWWKDQTGLDFHKGLDKRFELQRGSYRMTFASRGCPVNCYFCIVPKLEGVEFTLDWDFQPAPILCDNNLSALPIDFQEFIIKRYTETGTKLVDANSGFEPRTFDEGTFQRWSKILKGAWRFALDTTDEEVFVKPMMEILKDVPRSKKRVYCLLGNEPIEACLERALKIIEWGGEPYCQPVMPLNALSRDSLKVAYDWTWQSLKDMARYYNRYIYKSVHINEYKPRVGEKPPFANLNDRRVFNLGNHAPLFSQLQFSDFA